MVRLLMRSASPTATSLTLSAMVGEPKPRRMDGWIEELRVEVTIISTWDGMFSNKARDQPYSIQAAVRSTRTYEFSMTFRGILS